GSFLGHTSPSVPFVSAWNLTTGSNLNDAESCRDMMINLATHAVRGQHNRLIEAFRSRTVLSDDHKALQQVHLSCVIKESALVEKLAAVEREKDELLDQNKAQVEKIKQMEEALVSKDLSLSEEKMTVDNLKGNLEC
ncbi:hypothetical protein Tco_0208176, partial [Tanacetum coccineum]